MKMLTEADLAPARKAAKGRRIREKALEMLLSDEGCGSRGFVNWYTSIHPWATNYSLAVGRMLMLIRIVREMGYKVETFGRDFRGKRPKSRFSDTGTRFRITGYRPELAPIIKYVMNCWDEGWHITYEDVWDTLEDEEDRKLLEMVEKMLPAWTAGNCRKLVKTAKALLD